MKELRFDVRAWEDLKKVCEAGYPKEACGLLFGKISNGSGPAAKVVFAAFATTSKVTIKTFGLQYLRKFIAVFCHPPAQETGPAKNIK